MATKIKCARCRKPIPLALSSSCYYSIPKTARGKEHYYICPECAELMGKLLQKEKEPKENPNGKPY